MPAPALPPPDSLPAWAALKAAAGRVRAMSLRDAFAADPGRFARFSLRLDDLLLDISKQLLTTEVYDLLVALADQAGVAEWRHRMFAGEPVNSTEGRAVLHPALRDRSGRPFQVAGEDVRPEVRRVLDRMRVFVETLGAGRRLGGSGRAITDLVNIGIGGSDLGPAMATRALAPVRPPGPEVHYVANVDGAAIAAVLARCRPETTLFVVASKTFTTQETMTNARTARDWIAAGLGESAVPAHFVAVTANPREAGAFGIAPADCFEFWDWVGGRYSVWSAVGLALAAAIGFDNFERFLAGGWEMDEHFLAAPLARNLPVAMGLLAVWNGDFLGFAAQAVLPYDQNLALFPSYLQQLVMESNGKSVTRTGEWVRWPTSPVLFGEPGTNGQHAFYQMLHQGTQPVPADFLAAARSLTPIGDHHAKLLANCLAQAEALMRGRTEAEARAELAAAGLTGAALEAAIPHRRFEGNRPSTTILYRQLDPRTLGRLVALYEHAVFVAGTIWRINSFDQFGVELGKQLAGPILAGLTGKGGPAAHDSSTAGLIAEARRLAG